MAQAMIAHQYRPEGAGRRLLLVQRNELLLRAMARYFRLVFDEVYVASDPTVAQKYLSLSDQAPTDIICGFDFGNNLPAGSDLIVGWRQICPTLIRVMVVTGRDDVPDELAGVDAVFHKPVEPGVLCSHLFAFDS
jgi:DNA-binding response OmpR family regulator